LQGHVPGHLEEERPVVYRQPRRDHLDIDVISAFRQMTPLAAKTGTAAHLIARPLQCLRCLEVADVHLKEFVAGIAVNGNRRAIDVEEPKRLLVVQPRRLRTLVEKAAVTIQRCGLRHRPAILYEVKSIGTSKRPKS